MDNSIKVFDDFLPPNQYQELVRIIQYENFSKFPWHFLKSQVSYDEKTLEMEMEKEDKNNFQFVHPFYQKHSWVSPYSEILDPIIKLIDPLSIIEIKANLTTITEKHIRQNFNRDTIPLVHNCKTACYYVNTNNGSTIFSSGEEFKSIGNRMIIFDSNKLHAEISCTDETTKIVINFNYFSKQM